MKPSSSIAAAAAVLFAGCLLMLSGFGWLLTGVVSGHFRLGIPFPQFFSPPGLFVVVLPVCLNLLGLAVAVGVLRLREWARKATIVLSTIPVIGCTLLVLLQPSAIFPPPKPDEQHAILTIGSGLGLVFYKDLLVILVPLSIWWLTLFTRASIKARFRDDQNKQ